MSKRKSRHRRSHIYGTQRISKHAKYILPNIPQKVQNSTLGNYAW